MTEYQSLAEAGNSGYCKSYERGFRIMGWLTNEVLFYGGIIVAGCSVVAAVIYFSIAYVRWMRLSIKLDEEYGKRKQEKKR